MGVTINISVDVDDEEVVNWDYMSLESLEEDLSKINKAIDKAKEERDVIYDDWNEEYQ